MSFDYGFEMSVNKLDLNVFLTLVLTVQGGLRRGLRGILAWKCQLGI